MEARNVTAATRNAVQRIARRRSDGRSRTTAAPTSGRKMRRLRSGMPAMVMGGSPERQVAEDDDKPQRKDQGVDLHIAGLRRAEQCGAALDLPPDAVHRAVDDTGVEPLPQPLRAAHDRLDDLPVVQLVHPVLLPEEAVEAA